jgi:hypothetical protein
MEIETRFKGIPRKEVPLLETDAFGVNNLRKVASILYER